MVQNIPWLTMPKRNHIIELMSYIKHKICGLGPGLHRKEFYTDLIRNEFSLLDTYVNSKYGKGFLRDKYTQFANEHKLLYSQKRFSDEFYTRINRLKNRDFKDISPNQRPSEPFGDGIDLTKVILVCWRIANNYARHDTSELDVQALEDIASASHILYEIFSLILREDGIID